MEIKAVKFRKDGFYSQPFVFGGEEGAEKFDKNIRYRGSLQNYVIDTGKEVILVDTGLPAGFPEGAPDETAPIYIGKNICEYMDALAALGYKPEQVTKILLTHKHADHSGELRSFPNAKIYVNAEEIGADELKDIPNIVPVEFTDGAAAHKQGAVNMGNSQQLVDELCTWLCNEGYTLSTKWPKGEPNPYGKYFIGQSYLADVGGGVMNVTFEPGCRNNWHIHHKQVQVLICVAGKGWYQEWGRAPVEMTPGTIIAIPAEVKHWHGAQKDSWFQHLTYHKDVQEGASNEWCEPVDDAAYDALKQ